MTDKKTPLQKLDDIVLVATSPGNAHADHYLRGIANGLILAHHTMHDKLHEIAYIEPGAVREFDYMAEADKTCTVVFNPHNVNAAQFVEVLQAISDHCDELNIAKKLFFRGKTCDELDQVQPSLADSCAVEFDANNVGADELNLLHGLVGVITEAGEMADVLLHRMRHGEFDRVNVMEEGGDVLWYLARQLRGLHSNFDVMGKINIDKLRGRHGGAFDVFRDANRNLTAERAKLEASAPLFEGRLDRAEGIGEPALTDAPAMGVGGFDAAGRAPSPAPHYGPCEGSNPVSAPEPGLYWSGGCWRRSIVRDDTGLAV